MIALKSTLFGAFNALKNYRLAFRHIAELASQHNRSRRSLEGNSRNSFFAFFLQYFYKTESNPLRTS